MQPFCCFLKVCPYFFAEKSPILPGKGKIGEDFIEILREKRIILRRKELFWTARKGSHGC